MRRTSLSRSSSTRLNAVTPWRSAVFGALLGAASAALAFAPAAWLGSAVRSATGGKVVLAQTSGTVWHGSAQLVLTGGAGTQDAASLPERMRWRLLPTWQGARMQIELPCCAAVPTQPMQLLLEPGWKQMAARITDLHLDLPAQWLSGLGAPWNTLALQGQMRLKAQDLQLQASAGQMLVKGRAQLDVLQISSRLSTLSPLGDYRLELYGTGHAGDAASIELRTLQGALQLQGSGQWLGARLRFRGEASAAPGREEALSNVLNIIGRRQGSKSLISLG